MLTSFYACETVVVHTTLNVSVCIYVPLSEDAAGNRSALVSRRSLIEQRCPALWTMSPFQISGRPIEDNYNQGDMEEH